MKSVALTFPAASWDALVVSIETGKAYTDEVNQSLMRWKQDCCS